MKAITVKQPWAYLICAGIKDVENRTWKTNYRGRILIHASGRAIPYHNFFDNFTEAQMESANYFVYKKYDDYKDLTNAAIIGSVEIVDCIKGYPSIWCNYDCWNWVLANPVLFETPILNMKGKLSFWESGYEEIVCPQCEKVCLHDHTTGFGADTTFGNYCHECEHCGYMICESEWEDVNANIINKLTKAL
ncbi:MAG: ASCH domain-containing protein [Candidatus Symbiothrix sp.]|jgi:hypothetical protein|nr:ASCH domain-containing protein [Candidatus Symbiothrix sp.]